MSKIINDKYYTPIEIANHCFDVVDNVIGIQNIAQIIEPCCGDGAFYHHDRITPDIGYDICPEFDHDNIIKCDFLNIDLNYLEGRLFIGNPPYGYTNNLAIKFYNKCCELGDYIAFILPISQLNNNLQLYKFDLIYSEDIGIQNYSGRELHCCFNIYRIPNTHIFNSKPNNKLKDITIIEHRRIKGKYNTGKNKKIKEGYDYAICNWGNGSLGKVPEYIGQYAQECYFYCNKKEYKNKMIELLQFETIRNYVKSISMKKISVARLYKYLKDNIEGIE